MEWAGVVDDRDDNPRDVAGIGGEVELANWKGAEMSYCRFSSDDFKSDVYVYEDVGGGYTTHVAGRRVVGDAPHLDWKGFVAGVVTPEEFTRQNKAQHEWLDRAEHIEIGLSHDNESFYHLSLEETIETLEMLRAEGYYVPQYALDALREDLDEAS